MIPVTKFLIKIAHHAKDMHGYVSFKLEKDDNINIKCSFSLTRNRNITSQFEVFCNRGVEYSYEISNE